MSVNSNGSGVNLIDSLLDEQRSLTAVERFSQLHDHGHFPDQKQYHKLIPTEHPEQGEQYSFEVNLDACTGCKACVTACHSLNGLDEDESWRDVGVLFGGNHIQPRQQTVTTACHHCEDPACANGCPVLAYEKDEKTGIVRHLDDQCIGCQYCILKCPYDVPKYNPRLGIVRKCDMCIGRLEEGEAPACVQACPTEAIAIRIVKISDPIKNESMLPGAYPSEYTKPTTAYLTENKLPENTYAADTDDLTPEHEHTPLVWMLTLTQASIGMMSAAWIFHNKATSHFLSILGLVLGLIGMISSFLHLGSPRGAWRSFLGLKKSWLSREIVTLSMWIPFALLHVLSLVTNVPFWLKSITGWTSITLGLVGVFCSVMVYADTRREFWKFSRSSTRFFGTTLISGLVTAVILGIPYAALTCAAAVIIKLMAEATSLLPASQTIDIYARKSARLQLYPLRRTLLTRFTFGFFTVILAILLSGESASLTPYLLLGSFVLGEIFERKLYFRAVAALRMPGLIAP